MAWSSLFVLIFEVVYIICFIAVLLKIAVIPAIKIKPPADNTLTYRFAIRTSLLVSE